MREVKIETALNGFIVHYGLSLGPKEIFPDFKAAAREAERFLKGEKDVPDRWERTSEKGDKA